LSTSQDKAVRAHRLRLKERGLKRVEVHVAESDVTLFCQLAKILREDNEGSTLLRTRLDGLVTKRAAGLKALLAQAPLDGIRITRSHDSSRTIEL
jgi:hypothetical protein